MAAKKKTEDINEPRVVENDVDDTTNPTPAEVETINEDGEPYRRTLTVMVNGEEIELEDHWRNDDELPFGFSLLGSQKHAARYIPPVVESVFGEDQMMMLVEKQVGLGEFQNILKAWQESRGLKGNI